MPAARSDQGIGRAMWFVGGTDVELVATMIDKFPDHRRADLYSGAGLAATYAGGAHEQELRAFWNARTATARRSRRDACSPRRLGCWRAWSCHTPSWPRGCSAT